MPKTEMSATTTTSSSSATMFRHACDDLLQANTSLPDIFLRNSVVEAAVVHARNLCEVFLDETDERHGGIRMWRLLNDAKWETIQRYEGLRRKIEALSDIYDGKARGEVRRLSTTRLQSYGYALHNRARGLLPLSSTPFRRRTSYS